MAAEGPERASGEEHGAKSEEGNVFLPWEDSWRPWPKARRTVQGRETLCPLLPPLFLPREEGPKEGKVGTPC